MIVKYLGCYCVFYIISKIFVILNLSRQKVAKNLGVSPKSITFALSH